ncbi:MAG: cell division protein FtsA [Candidatus Spechtbacteria bacterium RIFCSPHIGHO2_02_FULL_43_15b]|uniref:Cell division protein FtsA n=1 Tax=Candidatus Spechtbacteria bacterium RIFCSPHIGHO2_01_FULL_43_30 TaxID=1802158 RepID=A0A1G2H912_9BACT|nr:MAG: cell division protein FtsA [Candidatus Spechtbacteria bacterium RIFCSPHIGHO2_01_FULL_43_30]OGZ59740.1 MAG: cell division protein FtsA [Candidatus Spechtbacteria bacterium RIFCSPHIGHO2_02_FULL_43_15b]
MANNIIVGIDIGSHSVYTVVAQKKEDILPQIIGIGFSRASGVRRGVIVDIEEAMQSISESVQAAERMAGVKIEKAIVSIGGSHAFSSQSRGVVAVSRADGEISAEDIDRVIGAAQTFSMPNNREILHVIPREFIVDGEGNIKDPLGMKGVRLEANTLIINGASPYTRNLSRCLNDLDIEVESTVLDTLAASKAVLTKRQKELGVVCVDIGGGTTGVAVYEEGDLLHTSIVPLGGAHITNDIAIGLRIPVEAAESIKLEYGSALASEVTKKDFIDLSYIDNQENGSISRKELCEIIEARLSEIFDLVNKELKKIGKEAFLPGGVVLVGGGAKTPHIVDFAKQKMRLPVQIGFPREVEGIVERVDDPVYATVLGLVFWGIDLRYEVKEGFIPQIPSLNNSVRQLRRWFKAFMP